MHFTPEDRIFANISFLGVGKLILAGLSYRSDTDTGEDFIGGVVDTGCKVASRHPTHLDQRPLRPPKLLQTKTAKFCFGGLRASDQDAWGCLWQKIKIKK